MKLRLTLILFGLLCLGASTASDAEPGEVPHVELNELRENRSQWLGKEVRFSFQVKSELRTWQAWVTPFGVGDYRGFAVWGDAALLWQAADFDDLMTRIFVRRGSAASKAMLKVRQYERFEVRAVVRTIFLDEPWIELTEVKRLQERVSQGTVLHAERALELIEGAHFELALSELDRARQGRLPAHIAQELGELNTMCQEQLSDN